MKRLAPSIASPALGWIALAGLAVGWMVGLSQSPVVGGVISSVLTLVVAVAAIASGITTEGDSPDPNVKRPTVLARLNALPAALLVVMVALGSSCGVIARENNLLGSHSMAHDLLDAGRRAGLDEKEIWKRYFDSLLTASPAPSKTQAEPHPSPATGPRTGAGLNALTENDCERTVALEGENLIFALKPVLNATERKFLDQLATQKEHDALVRQFRDLLCSGPTR